MLKSIISVILFLSVCFAQSVKVGEELKPFTLSDQFDKVHSIDTQKYGLFLISSQKEVSSWVNGFLKTKSKNFLDQNRAVYICDIHTMPSIVTSLFALPKMRKYNYTMMLFYEKNRVFPVREDALTVVKFKNKKVQTIRFIKDEKKIKEIFK
jgi:hypothetical protein